MDKDRAPFIISIIIAGVSLALGIWGDDGAMISISVMALILSILATVCCRSKVSILSVSAALTVLVCTVLMVTVFSAENMAAVGPETRDLWSYFEAVVQCIAIMPLAILLSFVIAAASGASYNWAIASGFAFFTGLGMTVPGHAFVFFLQRWKLDELITKNDVVAFMILSLVIFALFAIILGYIFKKKRYLITENGLEVMK